MHNANPINQITMPLISIIIPIYNGEKYLSKCLDSILAQRFTDFELLLINDGSVDSSLEICRRYATNDERIRIFDIPNGGVSAARNLGIANAKGEWVMFIDADDWVEQRLLELGLPYFDSHDLIVIGTQIEHRASDNICNKQFRESKNRDEYLKDLIVRNARVSPWCIFIRRSLYVDNNLSFNTTYNFGEDWLMMIELAVHARKVKVINDEYMYHYNMFNETSCCYNISIQKLVNNVRVITDVRKICDKSLMRNIDEMLLVIYNSLLRKYDHRELCDYLLTIQDKVEFYGLWDLIRANISVRKKYRLYKFLRYANSHGLYARNCVQPR